MFFILGCVQGSNQGRADAWEESGNAGNTVVKSTGDSNVPLRARSIQGSDFRRTKGINVTTLDSFFGDLVLKSGDKHEPM
jgi:hypothetical protein